MEAFFVLVVIVCSVVAVVAMTSQKVEENRHRNIAPTRLSDIGVIKDDGCDGSWVVSVFRQSGNSYKDDVVFDSKQSAIDQVLSTFRRSGEESPVITIDTQDLVEFKRWGLVHDNHPNGYNSKAIGTIVISRV